MRRGNYEESDNVQDILHQAEDDPRAGETQGHHEDSKGQESCPHAGNIQGRSGSGVKTQVRSIVNIYFIRD